MARPKAMMIRLSKEDKEKYKDYIERVMEIERSHRITARSDLNGEWHARNAAIDRDYLDAYDKLHEEYLQKYRERAEKACWRMMNYIEDHMYI